MNFADWIRLQLLGDNNSDLVGQYGEDLTARSLKWSKLFGYSGLMLRNVYIPAGIGETTEIDLIYITQKGLFVIESKNFSGWIFGREKDQYWTQSMPDKSKFRFFNPIWQNRGHIKWLKSFLKNDTIPCFSLIVFSERCELKQLQFYDENCKVIHRGDLFLTVRSMWKRLPDALDEKRKKDIYDTLSILQNADEAMKQAHVDRIQTQYSANNKAKIKPAAEETAAPIEEQPAPEPTQQEETEKTCPRCGAALILRTAKKGDNAGKQFYGCSAFPKCKYMSSTDEPDAEPAAQETAAPVEEKPAPEPIQKEATEKTCPRCGAALILRTAKKGDNAGKQFFGCSAFPKCRYMTQAAETE